MTRAVLDTGVLVSGIFWRHEPHGCVQAWLHGVLLLVVSQPVMEEYDRVLREVKTAQRFVTDLEPWLTAIRHSALWVTPTPLRASVCRDPKDDKFIEAALAGDAHLLIARDADLTVLEKPFGIEILTPRQFLSRLPRRIRRDLE